MADIEQRVVPQRRINSIQQCFEHLTCLMSVLLSVHTLTDQISVAVACRFRRVGVRVDVPEARHASASRAQSAQKGLWTPHLSGHTIHLHVQVFCIRSKAGNCVDVNERLCIWHAVKVCVRVCCVHVREPHNRSVPWDISPVSSSSLP